MTKNILVMKQVNPFGRTISFVNLGILTMQLLLVGCASVNTKEESISSILEKENELIEKLKVERAQPEIVKAIAGNENLKKAELHLALALDELTEANKTVNTKILKINKKENDNGKNQRNND